MTAGLNSRPKEWSRPPEPHPPDAGYWCSRRKRRPYVSLIWCSTPSGHGNGLKPWIRNNDRRAAHEPVNLPLDCKHAHVSSHCSCARCALLRGPVSHETGQFMSDYRIVIGSRKRRPVFHVELTDCEDGKAAQAILLGARHRLERICVALNQEC